MNKHEMFDKVASHLLIQASRSIDYNGYCAYKYEGKSCAIGCLIPDNLYSPRMEKQPIDRVFIQSWKLDHIIREENLTLAYRLQRMHDFSSPDTWKTDLLQIAQEFKLNTSVLDSF